MRTLTIAVKDKDGDWSTYEVLEILVNQPISVYSETGGTVTIRAAEKPLTWHNGRLCRKDDLTQCIHGFSIDAYCQVCREGL